MANNKKTRKKYTPKYTQDNYIFCGRVHSLFMPIIDFFTTLKKGKTDVVFINNIGKEVPVIKIQKYCPAAYLYLQVFRQFVSVLLEQKQIILDYKPIDDFVEYLIQRNERLFFDVVEINKVYALFLKIQNIIYKNFTMADLLNSRDILKNLPTDAIYKYSMTNSITKEILIEN